MFTIPPADAVSDSNNYNKIIGTKGGMYVYFIGRRNTRRTCEWLERLLRVTSNPIFHVLHGRLMLAHAQHNEHMPNCMRSDSHMV